MMMALPAAYGNRAQLRVNHEIKNMILFFKTTHQSKYVIL